MRCQDSQKLVQHDSHQPTFIQHRYGDTKRTSSIERESRRGPPTHYSPSRCPKSQTALPTTLCSSSSTLHPITQSTGLTPSPSLGQVTETQNIRNSRAFSDCYQVTPSPVSQSPNFLKDILNKALSITLNMFTRTPWEMRNFHYAASSLAKQL